MRNYRLNYLRKQEKKINTPSLICLFIFLQSWSLWTQFLSSLISSGSSLYLVFGPQYLVTKLGIVSMDFTFSHCFFQSSTLLSRLILHSLHASIRYFLLYFFLTPNPNPSPHLLRFIILSNYLSIWHLFQFSQSNRQSLFSLSTLSELLKVNSVHFHFHV